MVCNRAPAHTLWHCYYGPRGFEDSSRDLAAIPSRAMSDNGSHGGGRGGRGGGSARGGGGGRGNRNNNRRRTGSSRRVVIYRTDGNAAPSPAVTYRPIGDDAMEKIGREVSELVIASRPEDCAHLEVICAICLRERQLVGGQVQTHNTPLTQKLLRVDVNLHTRRNVNAALRLWRGRAIETCVVVAGLFILSTSLAFFRFAKDGRNRGWSHQRTWYANMRPLV